MNEARVYADGFERSFAEVKDLLEFLAERGRNAKWIRKPTNTLRLAPLEKSQLEKRKKEIEAEQRAISVPFVEQLGQGCKAVLEDGTNRYRITYNPTRRTSVGKDQMEKLKNQHPDIYEEYTKTTESRTFRIKKEAA